MSDTMPVAVRRRVPREPRRLLLAGAGVVAVGLGAVGVVVPGLPTTIFLIIASYCFTRSCPWLEDRLLRTPFFAPYMRYIDGRSPMPRRARLVAMVAMWSAVAVSLGWLHVAGRLGTGIAALLLGAAVIGTGAIAAYGRHRDLPARRPTEA
jgi:uncharacterized membrane protein YbaN (DUF454 family)